MLYEFSRTELLLGKDGMEILKNKKVAIYGIGGVGSFVVEGLARSGVENLVLVDDDCICLTNINRQIHADHSTVGRPKVDVMKERILAINPNANVETLQRFYLPGMAEELVRPDYDYIVDAIDTVTAKIDLIITAKSMGIPIISSMGTGNKMDPTKFEVADISETSGCPLAKVVRKELRNRGINSVKVVYSKEEPIKPIETRDSSCSMGCVCPKGTTRTCTTRHQIPGSISFMPSVAGLIIASEVIKDLIDSRADII